MGRCASQDLPYCPPWSLVNRDIHFEPSRLTTARMRAGRLIRWARDPGTILARAREHPPGSWGPDLDLPDPGEPVRTIIIASMPRTGSSLLSHRLESTGVAGVPDEYFSERALNWMGRATGLPTVTRATLLRTYGRRVRLHRFWDSAVGFVDGSVGRYLDSVVTRRTTPNGVFSVKLHWPRLRDLMTVYGVAIEDFPQPVD